MGVFCIINASTLPVTSSSKTEQRRVWLQVRVRLLQGLLPGNTLYLAEICFSDKQMTCNRTETRSGSRYDTPRQISFQCAFYVIINRFLWGLVWRKLESPLWRLVKNNYKMVAPSQLTIHIYSSSCPIDNAKR